jgi:hypothetical protein
MNFPWQQVPYLGYGMTIALDAVTHVVLSHGLAIGVVALIVILETMARSGGDGRLEGLARHMLKPAVIIITAVGAVTGVGIWFIVSALVPGGIGSMLRVFFWPWFIEWIVFTLEVVVLLVYYVSWDRMRHSAPGWHLAVGWSYVLLALCSAFLISGILGFMLTPDGWPWDKRFASAFFNPTFLPQFILRVLGGVALGALLSLGFVLFTRFGDEEVRARVRRVFSGVFLVAGLLTAGAAWWYFQTVPRTYTTHSVFAVLTSHLSQQPNLLLWVNVIGAAVLAAAGLVGVLNWKKTARLLIIPALILAVGMTAQFERVREFIRGPYLMPGYMYANQITLAQHLAFKKTGLLPHLAWYVGRSGAGPASAGRTLFLANCGVCHTTRGLNDIRDRVRGRTFPGISVLIARVHKLAPFMPPFTGNEAERLTLAAYLYRLAGNRRSMASNPPASAGRRGHE